MAEAALEMIKEQIPDGWYLLFMHALFFNMFQSLRDDRADMVVSERVKDLLAFAAALDEVALFEDRELVADRGLRHAEGFRKVADADFRVLMVELAHSRLLFMVEFYRSLTCSTRIAFKTAMTMPPTSAKMASHMFAMPRAPRTRQISFTPMELRR